MDNFVAAVVGILLLMGTLFIGAFLGGTILFFIWPVAIPAMFPGLVASGVIATKLAWWQAVCGVWLFSILIKSTSSTTVKK